MPNTAIVILFLAALAFGFVLGVVLYCFCEWISKQKTDPVQRRTVANGWRLVGIGGAVFNGFNLLVAVLRQKEADTHLIGLVLCAALWCGGYLMWKRRETKPL